MEIYRRNKTKKHISMYLCLCKNFKMYNGFNDHFVFRASDCLEWKHLEHRDCCGGEIRLCWTSQSKVASIMFEYLIDINAVVILQISTYH